MASLATIPGGYWSKGACYREAELRELTGEDQAFLMERAGSLLLAQWTTEVLARVLTGLGDGEPVTRETVRSLTVGDREALLLHLRRLVAGDRLRCLVTCPSADCGEELEVELKVGELLLPTYEDARDRYETAIEQGEGSYLVRWRLPTGFDQEAAGALARTDVEAAADLLLRRCVESVSADGHAVEELPQVVVEQLPTRMAERDAQAEVSLAVNCAACGGSFATVFDAALYLQQELRAEMRHLDQEVHLLAYHYHWSPTEILGLTAARRRRYLRVLEDELSRGSEQ